MAKRFTFILLAFSLLLGNAVGWCATLEVGPGKSYSNIQNAIDAAEKGDTIRLAPGEYNGPLTVNKNIYIVGPEKRGACTVTGKAPLLWVDDISKGAIEGISFIVKGRSSSPALRFTNVGSKFEISHCRFEGSGDGETGLKLEGKSSIQMRDVETRRFVNAAWHLTDGSSVSAENCTISKCEGPAFMVSGKSSLTLKDCKIFENDRPGMIEDRADLIITGAGFSGNEQGAIVAKGSSSVTMDNTHFKNNGQFAMKGQDETVFKLKSVSTESHPDTGIDMTGESTLNMEDCRFSHCGKAVTIATTGKVKHTATSCKFTQCNAGIVLQGTGTFTSKNTSFESCQHGMESGGEVALSLQDITFSKSTVFGLKTLKNCEAKLKKCSFEGGASGLVMEGSSFAFFDSCSWEGLSELGAEIHDNASFTVKKGDLKGCNNGLAFYDNATGSIQACEINNTTDTALTIAQTKNVEIEKSTIENAKVGAQVTLQGRLTSGGNRYRACSTAAIRCVLESGVDSTKDQFSKNATALIFNTNTGPQASNITQALFSKNTEASIVAQANSHAIVASATFSDEKKPAQVYDNARIELVKPKLNDISSGGLVARDESAIVLEGASFSGLEQPILSVMDRSSATLRKIDFKGGKGEAVSLGNEGTVEFTECKWKGVDGVVLQGKGKVTYRVLSSEFADVDIPIEVDKEAKLYLEDVQMKGVKNGFFIRDDAQLTAKNVTIDKCRSTGITISSSVPAQMAGIKITSNDIGILCLGSTTATLSGATITAKNSGMILTEGATLNGTDISVIGSDKAIVAGDNTTLRLKGGSVDKSEIGFVLLDNSRSEISSFVVTAKETGVLINHQSDIRLNGSTITAKDTGIRLKDAATLRGNQTIASGKNVGIHLLDDSNIDFSDLKADMGSSKGTCVLLEGKIKGMINGLSTTGGTTGVSVGGKMALDIKNVNISDAREDGIKVIGNPDVLITGGSISGCGIGANITQQTKPKFSSITFTSCELGIRCAERSKPEINNCKIEDAIWGVSVQENSAPTIRRLHIAEGKTKGSGIEYLNQAAGNLVEPTIVSEQDYGIVIHDSATPFISGSDQHGRVESCGTGIAVLDTSRPILYRMTVDSNKQNGLFVQGYSEESKASPFIVGCRFRGHLAGAGILLGENSNAHILGIYRKDLHKTKIDKYAQNIIRSNLVGVSVTENAKALIDGNMIENNSTGIEVAGESFATITRNHIRDSKFVEMDKRGEGIVVKEKASAEITDHNQIYKNRVAGIIVLSQGDRVRIAKNEIYQNVNLPDGSDLKSESLGAIIVDGKCDVEILDNYIHDNTTVGIFVASMETGKIKGNLLEHNITGAISLSKGDLGIIENNTLVGLRRDDYGILLNSRFGKSKEQSYFRNNIIFKFSRAFDAASKIRKIPKKWALNRNTIHNCDLENGSQFPDLLKNYKLDPIFHNPNGKGLEDFIPEPGSSVCQASARYDWGETNYCGAFACNQEAVAEKTMVLSILSPAQDGDIVPRDIVFKAEAQVPKGEDVSSWELYVNNNLVQQSRGIQLVAHNQDYKKTVISANVSSLPYGESVVRLVVNGELGKQWSAERLLYTARCSESHKRWVLLVGVSDYSDQSSIPDLQYAAADAIALGELLNRRSEYVPGHDVEVILLTDEQATLEGFRQALLGKIAPCARSDDEVIIFFAGHGLVLQDRFFLAMHDSDLNRPELTSYEMQELRDVIRYNIVSNRVLLLIDACHSGGVNLERKPANKLNAQLSQFTQSIGNLSIITASSDNEVSLESSCCCPDGTCGCDVENGITAGGHGYFTCALLNGMIGEANASGYERSVSLEILADYLENSVPSMTGERQHVRVLGNIDPNFVLTMPKQ